MIVIYVDADACPVKKDVYNIAKKFKIKVIYVANTWMKIPIDNLAQFVLVDKNPDAADDFIAEKCDSDSIVITSDIPLASRSLEKGAKVLDSKGRLSDEKSIGSALASRELMSHLREIGEISGGPAPYSNNDRSNFLQQLNNLIQALNKKNS